jgi:ribosome-associated translation inhibitor RaiA
MSKRKTPKRAPLASSVSKPEKTAAGRTSAAHTPLNVRTAGVHVSDALRARARAQLGRQLGKFAYAIERVTVRFEDVNGPRGGNDTDCRIKVVLSRLPSVLAEARGKTPWPAFAAASTTAERTVRRALEKSGRGGAGPRKRRRSVRAEPPPPQPGERPSAGSTIGRRVGRSRANLRAAAARPEKVRRDVPVDTSLPGVSATARKAGGSSTAARNTKLRDSGMSYTLEDSAQERPSRKSTRRSADRAKSDSNLHRRETRAVRAPSARAARASARATGPRRS